MAIERIGVPRIRLAWPLPKIKYSRILMSAQRDKRLLQELLNFKKHRHAFIDLAEINDSIDNFVGKLSFQEGIYRNYSFELEIIIPSSYPNKAPLVKFMTKICHPNIHFETGGRLCLIL